MTQKIIILILTSFFTLNAMGQIKRQVALSLESLRLNLQNSTTMFCLDRMYGTTPL